MTEYPRVAAGLPHAITLIVYTLATHIYIYNGVEAFCRFNMTPKSTRTRQIRFWAYVSPGSVEGFTSHEEVIMLSRL